MSTVNLTFAGGETKRLPGGIFLLLITTTAAIDLQFFRRNSPIGAKIEAVSAGFHMGPFAEEKAFDYIEVTSAVAQTIKAFVTDLAEAAYNVISGNVTTSPVVPTQRPSQTDVAVATGAAAVQIAAANANRVSIIVSALSANPDTVRVGGPDVAANKGTPLQPGLAATFDDTEAVWVWPGPGTNTFAITEIVK